VDTALDSIAGLGSGAAPPRIRLASARRPDRRRSSRSTIPTPLHYAAGSRPRHPSRPAAKSGPNRAARPRSLSPARWRTSTGRSRGQSRFTPTAGETGLAEYRRLATDAWEKNSRVFRWPDPEGGAGGGEFLGNQHQLMRILDFFAERAASRDPHRAARKNRLPVDISNRRVLSFTRAEKRLCPCRGGLGVRDGPPNDGSSCSRQLLTKAAKGDARFNLQRAFEKEPKPRTLHRLRKFGGEAARERVVRFLEAGRPARKIRWHNPPIFSSASACMRRCSTRPGSGAETRSVGGLEEELASDSEATHPARRLKLC